QNKQVHSTKMSTDNVEELNAYDGIDNQLNIHNTNAQGQIVLNDLSLMELLCSFPILFTTQDEDYKAWGWEQVTKSFNIDYEGFSLSVPFSTAELQWRWDTLRSLFPELVRASSQLPEIVGLTVAKVNRFLTAEKKPREDNPPPKCKQLILSQLPLLEALSQSQRRRLEAEVLDLILQEEMDANSTQALGPKEKETVQKEYDEFLRVVRVRELPDDTLKYMTCGGLGGETLKVEIDITGSPQIKTELEVSDFRRTQATATNYSSSSKNQEEASVQQNSPPQPVVFPRFVHITNAKYYIKKVRIRVKRCNLDDYIPLSAIRRSSRNTKT
ncbi:hypothetical protein KR009_011025, partial [Drosophila setifemur]